jgi:hypothetical protein
MLQTYEALLEPNGHLRFLEAGPAEQKAPRRVLVTLIELAAPDDLALCGAQLSEPALAEDWNRTEEDAAWAHLQTSR